MFLTKLRHPRRLPHIFYTTICYPIYFLYKNVLDSTFLYEKICYLTNFTDNNLLYKSFPIRNSFICYVTNFTDYNLLSKSFSQWKSFITYTKICYTIRFPFNILYPKHFLYKNMLSSIFALLKCSKQHIFYGKFLYPTNFSDDILLSDIFSIQIKYFLYKNVLSHTLPIQCSIQKYVIQYISFVKISYTGNFLCEYL